METGSAAVVSGGVGLVVIAIGLLVASSTKGELLLAKVFHPRKGTSFDQATARTLRRLGTAALVLGVLVALAPLVAAPATTSAGQAGPAATATAGTPMPTTADQSSIPSPAARSSSASAAGEYLTQLQQLGQRTPTGLQVGPVRMKGTEYVQGLRFLCQNTVTSVVYDVSKAKNLKATVGVPDDAKYQTSGVNPTITFYKDNSTVALGPPIVANLGSPTPVSIDLDGAVQLTISCSTNTPGTTFSDVALGDATLSRP